MNLIPVDERLITDEEVFSAFDLSLPSLAPVRSAFDKGDLAAAKKELIHYFETRTSPYYLHDYRSLPLQKIDTDANTHDFQSSMGLSGSLKEFCLYAGRKLMDHIYVRPGRNRLELDLGPDYENLPHFNFLEDQGKKHRAVSDIFVRGPVFEYLAVLYHETGDKKVLAQFEEMLSVFWEHYPLVLEYTGADASRFCLTEDRDVMSTGWLILQYISLFYTRIPYEIGTDKAFGIIKRIWFLGSQFHRFEKDGYRKYNHHMWERGIVPFLMGVLLPEITDFRSFKERGAAVLCMHIRDDFNESGGYSEHSIPYWSGAALCSMIYLAVHIANLNHESLLDEESKQRLYTTFEALARISPPQDHYPSLGDNGGPLVDPVLEIGAKTMSNVSCREILALRNHEIDVLPEDIPLDYADDRCGFVCCRSGYDRTANYLLMSAKVNCGDTGHNHMDMLSMFIMFRGQKFIGEPYARLLYHTATMGSAHRGYGYNMSAHNTVLAYGNPVQPDKMYANKWGVYRPDSPVSDFVSTDEGCFVSAYHDAYTTCRHRRSLYFHREKGLLIHDRMEHGNRLDDPHIQRWHLMPDVTVSRIDDTTLLLEKHGVKILCFWSGSPEIRVWKNELLFPEIVKTREELLPIIDVAFSAASEKAQDIATVSQSLLMLDVTDYKKIPDRQVLGDMVSQILSEKMR
ncbi:MAG: heparinase II/III family protein [Eubacteriales bacterium]|nr:heparinase II/III family protein [Eubacteriales bacterium]